MDHHENNLTPAESKAICNGRMWKNRDVPMTVSAICAPARNVAGSRGAHEPAMRAIQQLVRQSWLQRRRLASSIEHARLQLVTDIVVMFFP
jgi:hypothetical protein